MTPVPVDARAGGSPAAVPVAFSTAGLPDEQRVALWESHNADALIGLRCRTLTSAVLDASLINVQLERVHLGRVRGSSHIVERDLTMVRRRPADSIALYFSLVGEAFFYHDDGVRTLQPGQVLMCDADQPFLRGFSHGLEELVLKIPRTVFAEATGIEEVRQPVVTDFAAGSNAFAHALARQVGAAARDVDPDAAEEATLLELVGALTRGTGGEDLAAAHRAAAHAYVEQRLADPGLSAAQVAQAIGISTRHLSRVLAQAGTTFPQHVLARRLEVARQLLEKPAAASLSISELAHRCGFASAAHFSSSFTAHHGVRPSDVRRRAAAARALPPA